MTAAAVPPPGLDDAGHPDDPTRAGDALVLLALEDRLRPLEDAQDILRVAAAVLGQRLAADRVALGGPEAGLPKVVWTGATLESAEGAAEAEIRALAVLLRDGEPLAVPDVLAHSRAADAGAGWGRALLVAPLQEEGRAALLAVGRTGPRTWEAGEIRLARAMAGRAWAAAVRAQVQAALRQDEAQARARAEEVSAIYATAPIGLCVLDREGRYLRINDVLAAGNGLPAEAHLGRTVEDLLPGLAPALRPLLARALAGEELRGIELSGKTPSQPGRLRTWRESWVPLRDAHGTISGVTISVEEITEAKAAERRQAHLLRIEEALRAAKDARGALDGACALLGREIGASLVGLSRIEEDGIEGDGEHIRIESEWRADGTPSTTGRHRLGDYGEARVAAMRAGEAVVVADAAQDPRIPDVARYEAFGVRAAIEVPLIRDGRLRGHVFVCDARPRDWSADEVALVRETADRAWDAAERAGAEAGLRESEARFRQLAETIREVFYILEMEEGRMSYVSPAYEEVWGRPLSEILADARSFLGAVHPDDLALVQAASERLRSEGAVSEHYRILRPDGSVRHIHDRAAVVTDPATGRRRAFGLAADLTGRRRVEERLQLATEAAGIGIFDVDLLTGGIEWDARLRALWGLPSDLVVTDEVFVGGLHPEDRETMREAILRAVDPSGDGLYRAEYRLAPGGSGVARWIAAAGRVHFEGGRAVRLIGTVQDISARKEAEGAVAESEDRFRALANTIPAMIFVSDPVLGNVYSNERYQAYVGVGRDGLLGEGWRRAVHPDDLPRVDEAWARSHSEGRDYTVEVRVRRHDGVHRWHLTRGNPVRDAQGRIVQWVGAGTDIEEIVEAREALAASRGAIERANAELEARVAERTASLAQANLRLAAEIERRSAVQAALAQSQKLEAVGQLTSGIAHDFNNVIAAIAGGFSVIERRTQDPRLLEVARHGARAAERGGALVRQLLAFARQQVLTPRPCDLSALLREAEPLIARSLGPRIELVLDCAEGLREVRIDPVQLEAALINLAVNARDAMPDGGRVRLLARPSLPGEPGRPERLGSSPAVALAIEDGGTGMGPEVLSRALDPFFTTKEPGRGTGLGLAMVHGFVHQSDGALHIESREGAGTTVTIFLPLAEGEPRAEPSDPGAPESEPERASGTVLLVDDDEAVRGVTAAQLSDLGYEVLEASGAGEALAWLAARGDIGVVLSDVAMPGTDGVELAADLRRRRPGLPVLFMTGHADRARLAGEAVIDKPFTLGALATALAERRGA